MIAALLIALAATGPASEDDRPAESAQAVVAYRHLDLVDPFAEARRAREHSARVATPAPRPGAEPDLRDPFAPSREATASHHAVSPAAGSTDLRDPFSRDDDHAKAPHGVHGDEPDCAAPPKAENGAPIQRPDGLKASACAGRGRPHLVNPFAHPPAR